MVFVRETASLMLAHRDPDLNVLHDRAELVVPDGMPLVLIGRLRRHDSQIDRVSGADLVDALCARSVSEGRRHFFYGGKPGVAAAMAKNLVHKYPGLIIAGTFCPPMRDFGADFELSEPIKSELDIIRATEPDFIWVGISSPKQEYWMSCAKGYLDRGVMFGVGAAFDFHAGTVKRAPLWMQKRGLEWLHRLISEPKRLWRRYLLLAPQFVFLVAAEQLRLTFSRRRF